MCACAFSLSETGVLGKRLRSIVFGRVESLVYARTVAFDVGKVVHEGLSKRPIYIVSLSDPILPPVFALLCCYWLCAKLRSGGARLLTKTSMHFVSLFLLYLPPRRLSLRSHAPA